MRTPNAIRNAQQVLFAEGLLRSGGHAGGVYVAHPPLQGRPWPATASVRDELEAIQHATVRALSQLPDPAPSTPYVVDGDRQPQPLLDFLAAATASYLGRVWTQTAGYECSTCRTNGSRNRRWATPALDELADCGEGGPAADRAAQSSIEDHKVTRWLGADPDAPASVAKLEELEWERDAHTREAARLLTLSDSDSLRLADYLAAARWHAERAAELSKQLILT